jgi:hypothetical protein
MYHSEVELEVLGWIKHGLDGIHWRDFVIKVMNILFALVTADL